MKNIIDGITNIDIECKNYQDKRVKFSNFLIEKNINFIFMDAPKNIYQNYVKFTYMLYYCNREIYIHTVEDSEIQHVSTPTQIKNPINPFIALFQEKEKKTEFFYYNILKEE